MNVSASELFCTTKTTVDGKIILKNDVVRNIASKNNIQLTF